jgi:hypothetical protein
MRGRFARRDPPRVSQNRPLRVFLVALYCKLSSRRRAKIGELFAAASRGAQSASSMPSIADQSEDF